MECDDSIALESARYRNDVSLTGGVHPRWLTIDDVSERLPTGLLRVKRSVKVLGVCPRIPTLAASDSNSQD